MPTTKNEISQMIHGMKRVAQMYGSADMAKAAESFENGFNKHKSKELVG